MENKIHFHETAKQKHVADKNTNWNLIDLASPIGIVKNLDGTYIALPYDELFPNIKFAGILSAKPIYSQNILEVSALKDGFVYGVKVEGTANEGDYVKPTSLGFEKTTVSSEAVAVIISKKEDKYFLITPSKEGALTPEQVNKINVIDIAGDGSKYLNNSGVYENVNGSSLIDEIKVNDSSLPISNKSVNIDMQVSTLLANMSVIKDYHYSYKGLIYTCLISHVTGTNLDIDVADKTKWTQILAANNMVNIPVAVIASLTPTSTPAEFLTAWGGLENFKDIVEKVKNGFPALVKNIQAGVTYNEYITIADASSIDNAGIITYKLEWRVMYGSLFYLFTHSYKTDNTCSVAKNKQPLVVSITSTNDFGTAIWRGSKAEFDTILTKDINTIYYVDSNTKSQYLGDVNINSQPFAVKWMMNDGLINMPIPVNTTYNIIQLLNLANIVFIANLDYLDFTFINQGTATALLKFPNLNYYVDYTITFRIFGVIAGADGSVREFSINLLRADNTNVQSVAVIKTSNPDLNRRGITIQSYTSNSLDPFIANGVKLIINNPNTGSGVITLTGFELLIKGN